MKYANLPNSHLLILREKQANGAEKWAKSDKLHPTVDTYYEAFTRGAKAACSLPHMPFDTASAAVIEILRVCEGDAKWAERAWKGFWNGDLPDLETCIASTKKAEEPASEPGTGE